MKNSWTNICVYFLSAKPVLLFLLVLYALCFEKKSVCAFSCTAFMIPQLTNSTGLNPPKKNLLTPTRFGVAPL